MLVGALGSIFIGVLLTGMALVDISAIWQMVIRGVVIVRLRWAVRHGSQPQCMNKAARFCSCQASSHRLPASSGGCPIRTPTDFQSKDMGSISISKLWARPQFLATTKPRLTPSIISYPPRRVIHGLQCYKTPRP